jgi:hypothetical protein
LLPAVESIRLSWPRSRLFLTQAVTWRSDGKVHELSRVSLGKHWPQMMLGVVAASAVVLLGVVLVALKPQSGIPMLAGLMVLRQWKVLVAAVVALCLTSLPGTLLLTSVTGSLPALLRILPDNAAFMSGLPPGDLTRPFFVVLRAYQHKPEAAEPVTVTLLSLLIVTSLYHLTYDQILLYVGPISALPYVVETGLPVRSTRLLAAGGIVLFGMGLLFRPAVREQLVLRLGLSAPLVHHIWVAAPTVFTLMLVGGAIAVRPLTARQTI